jgi:uncharacterized protein
MSKEFSMAVQDRRSIYGISDEALISGDRILEIVHHSVKYAPSAFNSQSARAIVLLGDHHKKLWTIVKEILRKIVPAEGFPQTEAKIDSFRAGVGTVLFFEDQSVVQGMQKQFPAYADHFPLFSLQSSGMTQFIVWTALEVEGLGASLQHYSPLIDEEVRREWNVSPDWKLLSQLVFGKPISPPAEKTFQSIEDRVKVFA